MKLTILATGALLASTAAIAPQPVSACNVWKSGIQCAPWNQPSGPDPSSGHGRPIPFGFVVKNACTMPIEFYYVVARGSQQLAPQQRGHYFIRIVKPGQSVKIGGFQPTIYGTKQVHWVARLRYSNVVWTKQTHGRPFTTINGLPTRMWESVSGRSPARTLTCPPQYAL